MTTNYDPNGLIAGDYDLAKRKITLKSGAGALLRGTVLGRIAANAGAVTVGAGVLTGTGNGTLTLAGTPNGPGVQEGDYKLVCVEKTTDSGEFIVKRPDGTEDGRAIVGSAYAGQIAFTINDGSADYDQTSVWTVNVAIADTGQDKFLKSLTAATDGSQVPECVLAADADATSNDVDAPAYYSGEFAAEEMTFGAGHTKDTVKKAFAVGGRPIFCRTIGAVA